MGVAAQSGSTYWIVNFERLQKLLKAAPTNSDVRRVWREREFQTLFDNLIGTLFETY